jgi:hypothetical protein
MINQPRPLRRLAVVVAAGLCALALLVPAAPAAAQMQPTRATLTRVTGPVEVLRHGQTAWTPAVVGASLGERDEIRAFGGGSAVLQIPDGSSLMLAENSRLVVTKLEMNAGRTTKNAIFHLVVGKVRAVVTHAALTLVQTRQSNFAITTPTAVAAARGTDYVTVFNLAQQVTTVVVLREGQHRVSGNESQMASASPEPEGDLHVVRLGPPGAAEPRP